MSGCPETSYNRAIPSEAKNPSIFESQANAEILRFAQNDSRGSFCSILVQLIRRVEAIEMPPLF